MTRNYFTLKTVTLIACLFAISFFSFIIYSELDVALKDNDNAHIILLDREVRDSDLIDNIASREAESNLGSQNALKSNVIFADGVRLVKTLEDAQGNILTRSANPGETIYYVFH